MKTLPSRRRLLPRPPIKRISSWVVGTFLLLTGAWCWRFGGAFAWMLYGILALGMPLGRWLEARSNRLLRHLAAQRPNDSICTFARAFDCRTTDTLIIRGVYEELQFHYAAVTPKFPLRPTDRFETDLDLDPDDLEDLAQILARRIRRSFEQNESNPLYGRVTTVQDLVQFFAYQPVVG